MRVIVVGSGRVGRHIAQVLAREQHDIVVIDKEPERLGSLEEHFDLMAVAGNGASPHLLQEVGVAETDLLIAVTNNDEVNLLAAVIAKELGVPTTVARVRAAEYLEGSNGIASQLSGVDYIISPEGIAANAICNLLHAPGALQAERFADGQVTLVEIIVRETASLLDTPLEQAPLPDHCRIVGILRGDEMLIPRGRDRILLYDRVFVLGATTEIANISLTFGSRPENLRRTVIVGGGVIGAQLARSLEREGGHALVIEKDPDRCLQLATELNRVSVLQGDGTDIALLKGENVGEHDAFVTVTREDETNIMSAMLAGGLGARKTIVKVRRGDYRGVVERIHLSAVINPLTMAANSILAFVRRGQVVSVSLLEGLQAEAFELIAEVDAPITYHELKERQMPEGSMVGAIRRGSQVIIPTGEDQIFPQDRVVVICLETVIQEVERLFAGSEPVAAS